MTVTTTFGYNPVEDRLWVSCSGWSNRLWLTRRMTQMMVALVARVLENSAPLPPSLPGAQAVPPAERAAREHDASLNHPPPGEGTRALVLGRDTQTGPAELAAALLCTRFSATATAYGAELVYGASDGERKVQLSRTGLHRWLHALHIVLGRTGWPEWQALPEWLTRSYLPAALKKLLTAADSHGGHVPPPEALG